MKSQILSVGFGFPGNEAEYVPFRSDRSLLDADVIIFEPDIMSDYSVKKLHMGKPLLYESDSFFLVENIAHWHAELKTAFEAGKTIFVFLSKPQTVFVYTG